MTKHAPQSFLLERTRLKGEFMGLIHPDYSVRAMFRSPAGFVDGTNTYSREFHLLYQWVHVAVTYDDTAIRIYINGELSGEKKWRWSSTPRGCAPGSAAFNPVQRASNGSGSVPSTSWRSTGGPCLQRRSAATTPP